MTCLLHAFALFDQDLPFAFIADLHPWYRWPSSILSFAFLGICLFGVLCALQAYRQQRRLEPPTFLALSALIMTACYLVLMLPTETEARYALPLYVLLSPLGVLGLLRVRQTLLARRYWLASGLMASFGFFLAACVCLSTWIESQAPRLKHTSATVVNGSLVSGEW